ncbi:MAG: 1-phosphofructokinase family hexose kinase [Phycisphaerae bacterium]
MPKIIAVSLNPSIDRGIEVPGLTIGAHQVGRQLFRRPAGKAANLTHTLGILKVPTLIVGFVGKGQQDYFEQYLNSEHVSCQFFPVWGQTRENITLFDPASQIETHIRDRGFEVSSVDINHLKQNLAQFCRKDVFVVFNGSLPPGLSVEDFVGLVQICQTKGARVCVDSSGQVLRACRPLGVWMIKPNVAELSEMLETPLENPTQIIVAGNELKKNIPVVAVTMGKDGACLFSGTENFEGRINLDPNEIKNTVGCGDAFLAGFLAGVTAGKNFKESFAQALTVATAAAISLTPGEVSLADIDHFFPLAEIFPFEE